MTKTKEWAYLGVIVMLLAASAQLFIDAKTPISLLPSGGSAEVYFNQEHKLNEKIIDQIEKADQYIYFAVYTFTRTDIRNALLAAKMRGLDIKGVSDQRQYNALESQKKIIDSLREAGIPVVLQTHSGLMHLKVLVTDKAFASGSFNWTASGTDINDEVLEIGTDPHLHRQYQRIVEHLFELYQ